jgi:hypothetical protein
MLNAPLAKEAGGLGMCRSEDGKPYIFADKRDPDYQTILAAIEVGKEALYAWPRADMDIEGEKKLAVLETVPPDLKNLALGATASSSGDVPHEGPHSKDQHAVDGDPETLWDKADHRMEYRLAVQFREPTEVSAVSVTGWAHEDFSPKSFVVFCDGKAAGIIRDARYRDNRLVVAFPVIRCRTLELAIKDCYGGSPGIRELEIYRLPACLPGAREEGDPASP